MNTTIKNKTKWFEYCGIAGMTAKEWVKQVLRYERVTPTRYEDVMAGLSIGRWSHAYHYRGDYGVDNAKHAKENLIEEIERLASDLDKRLHQLTAVENAICQMEMDRL